MVIPNVLTPEQEAAGFAVTFIDDHLVTLCRGESLIGTYSAQSVTAQQIRADAQRYLDRLNQRARSRPCGGCL